MNNLHPHTLQHNFVIHFIRLGHVNIRRLQQLLGHANIQTSGIYLQFMDSDLLEVYNRVEWWRSKRG